MKDQYFDVNVFIFAHLSLRSVLIMQLNVRYLGYSLKYIRYYWSPLLHVPLNNSDRTCYYQLTGFLFHPGLHLAFGINTRLTITNYHDNHSHLGIQFTMEQCQHVTYYCNYQDKKFPYWILLCVQCVHTSTTIPIFVMAYSASTSSDAAIFLC